MQEIARRLSAVPLEKSEIIPFPPPLIWSFYTRFFPVKVVIRQLAILQSTNNQKWIELETVQDEAFTYSENISDSLREYEDDKNIPRNEKLSTGLPLPRTELRGLRKSEREKRENKLVASKIRFQEQFVGRYIKKDSKFKGACFEMGLMSVKIEDNSCFVGLTEVGRELALMENPILDDSDYAKAFSDNEVKFILEKIIPKFELEKIIVVKILDELKNKKLSSDEIDKIFEDEKRNYYTNLKVTSEQMNKHLNSITQERVATMGRLSELQAVVWKIDNQGKSVYSLEK